MAEPAGAALRAGSLVGAADLPGDGCRRQGQHHQARHVRRQSAGLRGPLVQGAVDRGARSRFPVAHDAAAAAPRPHRHLQSLVLRGDAGRARAPEHPRAASSCRRSSSPRTSGASASRTSTRTSATCRGRACWSASSSCTCRRTSSASASWSGSTKPEKHWKFSPADVGERAHFADYMAAYEDTIRHTATERAPWYVVPADRKWFTRLVVSAAIIDAIQSLDPRFPEVDPKVRAEFKRVKAALEAEAKAAEEAAKADEEGLSEEVKRCWWPGEDELYVRYHDHEWGRPVTDDRRLFEKICLEGFQSGLSWITILRKRENFRKRLQGFRSRRRRALRRARRAAPAEGRRHRPASRQDRIDDQQREARARADRREGLAGGVLLVVGAGGVEPAEDVSRARAHEDEHDAAVDRAVEGSEEARLDVRRSHHLLCVHAGDGPRQRSRRRLLRARRDRTRAQAFFKTQAPSAQVPDYSSRSAIVARRGRRGAPAARSPDRSPPSAAPPSTQTATRRR